MCCRSRCYAPIKRVVPLLHSTITPTMTPSLTSDIADASDNMRDGNQQPFSQVIILCICAAEASDAMPQLKKVSLCFTASPHRSRCHLSRGAAHPSTQLAKTAWWGNAVLHGGEPRGPRRVGCQRIISQARDVPPQVSAQQTMQPIRLTPSDHSGCNPEPSVLLPDPSVDSQGWCRE